MAVDGSLLLLRREAGRYDRPTGWSVLHIVFDGLALGAGKDREAVRVQVIRVVGSAIRVVARLTDTPGDAEKSANSGSKPKVCL